MKRALAYALLALLLAGCVGCAAQPAATSAPTAAPAAPTAAPAAPTAAPSAAPATAAPATAAPAAQSKGTIELTKCLVFNDATDYPDLKEQLSKDFEKLTGYTLKLNILPRNEYIEKLNLQMMSGTLQGLVQTFGVNDLIRYKADDVIQPMETLRNNDAWKAMPQEFQIADEFDGKIWGIPQGFTANLFVRSYRQDWLDNLGLKAPKTVEELAAVAKAFTTDDPDKNGKADTTGLTAAGTWNLQDVFQAFDARLDHTGSLAIGYDPALGYWSDSMTKPEMIDALKYLRDLYEKGYLDKEVFTNKGSNMREKMWSGKYGSTFYWNGWAAIDTITNFVTNEPNAKITEVMYTTGKRTEKVNFLAPASGAPIVMVKGTKDADKMAEAFMTTFFSDEAAHLLGRFGLDGTTFKREGTDVVRLIDPATKNMYPQSSIVSEIPLFGPSKIAVYSDGTAEEKAKFKQNFINLNTVKDAALKDPAMYQAVYDTIISDTYTKVSADITKATNDCMAAAITGGMSVEDAVKQYKSVMDSIGAAKVLDEVNAAYGMTAPAFSYK